MGRDFRVFDGVVDRDEEGYWSPDETDFPMKDVSRHNDHISHRIEGTHRTAENLVKVISALNEELRELTNLREDEVDDVLIELGEKIGEKDLVKLSEKLEKARGEYDAESSKLVNLEREVKEKYINDIYKNNKSEIDDLSETIAVAALLIPMVPITVRYN